MRHFSKIKIFSIVLVVALVAGTSCFLYNVHKKAEIEKIAEQSCLDTRYMIMAIYENMAKGYMTIDYNGDEYQEFNFRTGRILESEENSNMTKLATLKDFDFCYRGYLEEVGIANELKKIYQKECEYFKELGQPMSNYLYDSIHEKNKEAVHFLLEGVSTKASVFYAERSESNHAYEHIDSYQEICLGDDVIKNVKALNKNYETDVKKAQKVIEKLQKSYNEKNLPVTFRRNVNGRTYMLTKMVDPNTHEQIGSNCVIKISINMEDEYALMVNGDLVEKGRLMNIPSLEHTKDGRTTISMYTDKSDNSAIEFYFNNKGELVELSFYNANDGSVEADFE